MKGFLLALLLAAPAAGCEAAPSASYVAGNPEDFPRLTGRVVDEADLLSPAQERVLTQRLAVVESEVGPQFVVATVTSLRGRPIEDYSIDLARTWRIGSKERNDGLVLLVAPNERKVRIEVGKGLDRRVTDPFAGEVIRNLGLPEFRRGRMAKGIMDVSTAVIQRLRSKETDAEIARKDHLLV